MDHQGSFLQEADFWFCIHPGCRNQIVGPFDHRIVKRDHSNHTDINNFTTFHESCIKFLEMVERGELSPPYLLEQAVRALANVLHKKFTIYLDSFEDALLGYSIKNTSRKIRLAINHRFQLYGALVAKD
jgi:hypothetical protein